jgi:DNA-binding Lrp family transcriptional regulator
MGALFFDVRPPSGKGDLKRQISAMDKVLLVCDYLGSKLSVVFCYRDEEDLKKITRRITRLANFEDVVYQNKPFLPCKNLKLTPADWKIISALQKSDPWKKSFSSVAREAGLSTKTVKNRIQRLVGEGAIYLLVSVNLESFKGFVPADLNIVYENPEYRDEVVDMVKEFLGETLVFADIEDRQHGYFALALPRIARIRTIENWVKSCEGVRNARVEVLHEIMSIGRFYDEEVRKGAEPSRISASLKVPS